MSTGTGAAMAPRDNDDITNLAALDIKDNGSQLA